MERRNFLATAGLISLSSLVAMRTAAAPVLSANNFGLTYAKAIRANCWAEISAKNVAANIGELRKVIGTTPLCVVIKADCYGYGLALLMPTFLAAGVRIMGFTSNEEARIAREMGFKGRLVRLRTATLTEVEDALNFHVEEMVGNPDYADALNAIAARKGRPIKVHFMLNSTGMCRNGLELSTDAGKLAARHILGLPQLNVIALMSHFPVDEVPDQTASLAAFHRDCDWFFANTRLRRESVALHIANSFGTLNLPGAHLDMVRCGAVIYGDMDDPQATPQYKQIMTLKSRVASINPYQKGQTVAYDRTYRLERDSLLANIPIGYSDGERRIFSHGNRPDTPPAFAKPSFVLIAGQRVPLVGRVTMNTLMADVTDLARQVKIGDEVVLLGAQGNQMLSWAELETRADTIIEDLSTVLGHSVPRVLAPDGCTSRNNPCASPIL